MVTEWHPDSCQCIIQYDDKIKFVDYIQKCQLHKNHSGQKLLDEIHSHNKKYRLKDQIPARRKEHQRILSKGEPIKKEKENPKKKNKQNK